MCSDDILRNLYFSLVHSRLDYGITCWGGTYKTNLKTLSVLQKLFVKIILKKKLNETSFPLFIQLKILPIRYMYVYKVLRVFYASSKNCGNTIKYKAKLRNPDNVYIPKPTNTFFTKTFNFLAPRIYNLLPQEIRKSNSISLFSNKLRTYLFSVDNIEEIFFSIQV